MPSSRHQSEGLDLRATGGPETEFEAAVMILQQPPSKRIKKTMMPIEAPMPKIVTSSWSSLCPELVGRVTTYLNTATNATNSDDSVTSAAGGDLINICLVAGPDVSATIRTTYLRNNDDYLYSCLSMDQDRALARRDRILSWMEVNAAEWKTRCLGSRLERNVVSVTLDATTARGLKFSRGYCDGLSGIGTAAGGPTRPSRIRIRRGDLLLSVNGVHVAGKSDEKIDSIINDEAAKAGDEGRDSDSVVVLRFEPAVSMIFSDPRRIISFGLEGVLKHMIDANLISANERIGSIPLLWYSITSAPDTSIIECLLSSKDIDCNARLSGDDGSMLPLHYCSGTLSLRKGMRYLELLAKHPSTDPNARCDGDTPLHHLLSCVPHPGNEGDATISIIKLLLENGADPLLTNREGYTSLDMMGHWIDAGIRGQRNEHVQRMIKMRKMMEAGVAVS